MTICAMAIGMAAVLSSCTDAIPTPPNLAASAKAEKKDAFYDALASSEMTKVKKSIEAKLAENGNDYVAAGRAVRAEYAPYDGVHWSYVAMEGGNGYILKVWTDGGTFNSEENSLSVESYSSTTEEHSHEGETEEEHAVHSSEDPTIAPSSSP